MDDTIKRIRIALMNTIADVQYEPSMDIISILQTFDNALADLEGRCVEDYPTFDDLTLDTDTKP